MINAIIIDDEQFCIDALEAVIKRYCPEVNIVDTCLSGQSGILSIEKENPHLIFLDIAMPKMDGFEMLDKIDNIDFEVIFTTAYDSYAIQAFKVNAIDYILKPIDRKELQDAILKAKERIELKSNNGIGINMQIKQLLTHLYSQNESLKQISIPTFSGLEMIKVNDILYMTSDGNYTNLIVKNKSPYLISKSIKYLENKLAKFPFFFRIHNSSIINLNELKQYFRGKSGYVLMSDGKSLNVARDRKKLFLEKLEYYI